MVGLERITERLRHIRTSAGALGGAIKDNLRNKKSTYMLTSTLIAATIFGCGKDDGGGTITGGNGKKAEVTLNTPATLNQEVFNAKTITATVTSSTNYTIKWYVNSEQKAIGTNSYTHTMTQSDVTDTVKAIVENKSGVPVAKETIIKSVNTPAQITPVWSKSVYTLGEVAELVTGAFDKSGGIKKIEFDFYNNGIDKTFTYNNETNLITKSVSYQPDKTGPLGGFIRVTDREGKQTVMAMPVVQVNEAAHPTLVITDIADYVGDQATIAWNGQGGPVTLYSGLSTTDTLDVIAKNLAESGSQTFSFTNTPEGERYIVGVINSNILGHSGKFNIDHTKPYLTGTTNLTSPVDSGQPIVIDLNTKNQDGSQEKIKIDTKNLSLTQDGTSIQYQTSFNESTNQLTITPSNLEPGKTYQLSFSVQDEAGNVMDMYSTEFQTGSTAMEWKSFGISMKEDELSDRILYSQIAHNIAPGTTFEITTDDENKLSVISDSEGFQLQGKKDYNSTEFTPIKAYFKAVLNGQTINELTKTPKVTPETDIYLSVIDAIVKDKYSQIPVYINGNQIGTANSDGTTVQIPQGNHTLTLGTGQTIIITEQPYELNNGGADVGELEITTADANDFKFDEIKDIQRDGSGQNDGVIHLLPGRVQKTMYVNLKGVDPYYGAYDVTDIVTETVNRLNSELGEHCWITPPDANNVYIETVNSEEEEGALMGKLIDGALFDDSYVVGMATIYLKGGSNGGRRDPNDPGFIEKFFWAAYNVSMRNSTPHTLIMTELGQAPMGPGMDSVYDYWKDTIMAPNAVLATEDGISSKTTYRGQEMSKEKNAENAMYNLGRGTTLKVVNDKKIIEHQKIRIN